MPPESPLPLSLLIALGLVSAEAEADTGTPTTTAPDTGSYGSTSPCLNFPPTDTGAGATGPGTGATGTGTGATGTGTGATGTGTGATGATGSGTGSSTWTCLNYSTPTGTGTGYTSPCLDYASPSDTGHSKGCATGCDAGSAPLVGWALIMGGLVAAGRRREEVHRDVVDGDVLPPDVACRLAARTDEE